MNRRNCFTSWIAFQKGERLAEEIFNLTKTFTKEEKYSLTDQIRRSSRSVCSNLGEAHAKRRYPKHFYVKLTDALGENNETLVWLRFARQCAYISEEEFSRLTALNTEIGKLLSFMMKHPEKFGLHQQQHGY